ncbi:hypothetical protein [Cohnella massiliensis]|uniref:hypothetical protein n=1 Tax=Cohnella massiliensis TaxID=1816691 RepID=UPI001119CDF3|nr:hypothetical protein [Cohnella massiliensis]
MRKKSWKKPLIWIGSILSALILIVGIGGYFAINYAADKVLISLVDPVEDSLDFSSAQTDSSSPNTESSASPSSDQTSSPVSSGASSSPSNDPALSPSSSEAPESPSSTPKGSEQPALPSTGTNVGSSGQADQVSADNQGEESSPPTSSQSPLPSKSPSSTYNPEISVEKAEEVQESITFSEKTKVMTIMLSKLSTSDIKTLQQLSSGGLTSEKKKEAKEIILQKLSEDEYNELIAIAKKYGLSQGTSYEDSLEQINN